MCEVSQKCIILHVYFLVYVPILRAESWILRHNVKCNLDTICKLLMRRDESEVLKLQVKQVDLL